MTAKPAASLHPEVSYYPVITSSSRVHINLVPNRFCLPYTTDCKAHLSKKTRKIYINIDLRSLNGYKTCSFFSLCRRWLLHNRRGGGGGKQCFFTVITLKNTYGKK
jgi:hypothetical protein